MKPTARMKRHVARAPILIATVFDEGLIEVFEYHYIHVGGVIVAVYAYAKDAIDIHS